ncbi:DNA cytosine methyltransferase [Ornithinimicrobium avium]|nr:DNA cytosine methyltransferase [Ornithinimicrobium avium]
MVDLFSGCGGLSVGAHEAARATGHRAVHVLAADNNEDALAVFGENFPEAELHSDGIEALIDGDLGEVPTTNERRLAERLAGLDLVIGGPPCQGHSDLNNHTRRADPRNSLYLRMARFAEVVHPQHILIENVPGVAHDKIGVVQRTMESLRAKGYYVETAVLNATDFGAAQARRRHLLLATLSPMGAPSVATLRRDLGSPARSVMDAIGDLAVHEDGGTFDTPARHSPVNRQRINYLFDHGLWDLPNEQRPDCHRLKPHSYVAVYGRMHGDRPSPTITSGFGSTGQGRFVHPTERRTLTPHEAARLQGFPDWFTFRSVEKRGALQQMIGNAVPSRLAYAAVASLLR